MAVRVPGEDAAGEAEGGGDGEGVAARQARQSSPAAAQPPAIPVYTGPELERTRLAEGVYAFVFDNPLGPAINTHWHGDHNDGNPLTAADSALLREYIALHRWIIPEIRDTRIVLPTLTLADPLVLHRTVGGAPRTIAIRYLGRGNTRGDVVVHLPRERIVATGDLLVNPVPYSFGSYLGEWARTLGAVRALGADVIVPGHGALQRDAAYLDLVVRLLEETVAQARQAVGRGLDLEGTRNAVSLDSLRARFTGGDPARERAFDAYFTQPALERAWREVRRELDRPKR